jgi:hypothetical protein
MSCAGQTIRSGLSQRDILSHSVWNQRKTWAFPGGEWTQTSCILAIGIGSIMIP